MFTLHNPAEHGWEELEAQLKSDRRVSYLVYQLEVGTEGTPHIQGYLELSSRVSWNVLQESVFMGKMSWFDTRRGTQKEAIHYVTKPHPGCDCEACSSARSLPNSGKLDGPWEHGKKKKQGKAVKRTTAFISAIESGATNEELRHEHPVLYAQRSNLVRQVRSEIYREQALKAESEGTPVRVQVLYGESGSGKTQWAQAMAGGRTVSVQFKQGALWLADYNGEEVMVFDEFVGQVQLQYLLDLLDPFKRSTFPIKGSFVTPHLRKIYVISNKPHNTWYRLTDDEGHQRNDPEVIKALYRRLRDEPILRFARGQTPVSEEWDMFSLDAERPLVETPLARGECPVDWLLRMEVADRARQRRLQRQRELLHRSRCHGQFEPVYLTLPQEFVPEAHDHLSGADV